MIPRHLAIAIVVMLVIALGMSFFVWRMRGKGSTSEFAASNAVPVAPPVTGPTEQVTLYVADDDLGALRATSAVIPLPSARQQRGEELLRALLGAYAAKSSHHVLGSGSDVRAFYLVEPGLAVIDLNSAFADGHRSGVLVEELSVASLAKTLSANLPGLTQIQFLVDGKQRDTLAGHADLSSPYDISAMNQLAEQLQGGQ
jgi:hypothetical protein